jgi:uncharacterized delta-60 repeat protein
MKTRMNLIFALLLTLALLAAAPYNLPTGGCNCAPGDLDETFDSDGLVTGGWAYADDYASAVAIQQDGKIVAAGTTENFGNERFEILRFEANGAPDASFGFAGLVTTSFGDTRDFAKSVAIQADGKIVVAGYSIGDPNSTIAIARYNSNGSLDTTFDGDGKASFDLGVDGDRAHAVAIQSDGKIVIAGFGYHNSDFSFIVARLNANGSLDATFNGGYVVTSIAAHDARGNAMVIQPDGKILVAGSVKGATTGNQADIMLVRYNSNGSLDTTFSGDGMVISGYPDVDVANAVAIQPDGKIVIAGVHTDHGIVVQYSNLGAPLGNSIVSTVTEITAIAIQLNNKILAVGYHSSAGTGADFAVLRFNSDLTPDAIFKTGIAYADFSSAEDYGDAIAIQPDGKIVVAGSTMPNPGTSDFALARYWGDRYVFLPMLVK